MQRRHQTKTRKKGVKELSNKKFFSFLQCRFGIKKAYFYGLRRSKSTRATFQKDWLQIAFRNKKFPSCQEKPLEPSMPKGIRPKKKQTACLCIMHLGMQKARSLDGGSGWLRPPSHSTSLMPHPTFISQRCLVDR